MTDGIAHVRSSPPARPVDADAAEQPVDEAVGRVEQPLPQQRHDDPARDDREEVHRPEQVDAAQRAVDEHGEAEAADHHERQVADEVVERVAQRPAEVLVVPQLAVVVEPDELGRADQVPLLQADPQRADHRADREREQGDAGSAQERRVTTSALRQPLAPITPPPSRVAALGVPRAVASRRRGGHGSPRSTGARAAAWRTGRAARARPRRAPTSCRPIVDVHGSRCRGAAGTRRPRSARGTRRPCTASPRCPRRRSRPPAGRAPPTTAPARRRARRRPRRRARARRRRRRRPWRRDPPGRRPCRRCGACGRRRAAPARRRSSRGSRACRTSTVAVAAGGDVAELAGRAVGRRGTSSPSTTMPMPTPWPSVTVDEVVELAADAVQALGHGERVDVVVDEHRQRRASASGARRAGRWRQPSSGACTTPEPYGSSKPGRPRPMPSSTASVVRRGDVRLEVLGELVNGLPADSVERRRAASARTVPSRLARTMARWSVATLTPIASAAEPTSRAARPGGRRAVGTCSTGVTRPDSIEVADQRGDGAGADAEPAGDVGARDRPVPPDQSQHGAAVHVTQRRPRHPFRIPPDSVTYFSD